jgi:hypothetical protein
MKKFRLLLLDTNVILELIDMGIWEAVVAACDVHVARTVVDEAQFVKDEDGFPVSVDLVDDEIKGRITVFEVEGKRLAAFKSEFKPSYFEKLDAGELESLTHLFGSSGHHLIVSSDKVVFRVLGCCGRGDQGQSLEEVLDAIGMGRPLRRQFSREYREEWTNRGFQEYLTGQALKFNRTPDSCTAAARGKSA